MPTINLSDACDVKLKTLAAKDPFVTREFVIERLIDDAIARNGVPPNGNGHAVSVGEDVLRQDPDRHENLEHTRVISANLDGRELYRPKWNTVYNDAHVLARQRLGSFDAVKHASRANLRSGKYEGEGYKPLAETEFSIQGVSANLAWEHSLTLARELNVPIKIVFEWREKDGAAHPGQRGIIEWTPNVD